MKIKKILKEIIKKIDENEYYINPYYRDLNFDVSYDDVNNTINVFIYTKFVKLPKRHYCEIIKQIFEADSVNFIQKMGEDPAFWAIEYKLRRKKNEN